MVYVCVLCDNARRSRPHTGPRVVCDKSVDFPLVVGSPQRFQPKQLLQWLFDCFFTVLRINNSYN